MNKWWKAGLLGAGALGLTALTGGAAAGPLAGLLGGEGAAAGAAGAAGAGEAAAAGTAAAGAGEAASMGGASAASMMGAATAPGATAFVTPPVTGMLAGAGDLSGTLAGTDMAYGGHAALAEAPSAAPSMMQQAADYAKMGGKAASAYGMVNGAMGGQQPAPHAPAPMPIYQGQAAPIAQGLMGSPQQNQFAAMLLAQRQRGMLG